MHYTTCSITVSEMIIYFSTFSPYQNYLDTVFSYTTLSTYLRLRATKYSVTVLESPAVEEQEKS